MSVKLIRCSKLARPMSCIGSLFYDIVEKPPGGPAMEGTACAEYLEHLIKGTDPGTVAKNGVAYDSDMKFYAGVILEDMKSRAVGPIESEMKVAWMTPSGINIQGSYDASYVDANGDLHIEDLKYGWKIVDAEENWQLIGYAIGEVMRRQRGFPKIHLTIQQPRPYHEDGPIRTWTITYDQLLAYMEQINAMAARVAAGDKDLVTGPHCRYCEAAPRCPAFNRSFNAAIDYATTWLDDEIPNEQLAKEMELIDRVTEIMKIKKDSISQLAVDRIRSGQIVPGYAIEMTYGDRVWKPGVTVETLEALTGKRATDTRPLSPSKMERLGVPKSLVSALVEKPSTGAKVVKRNMEELGNEIFGATAPVKGR